MTYYFSDNPGGFVTVKKFSIDAPCVTVMAAGMGGDSLGHWHFADDSRPEPNRMKKTGLEIGYDYERLVSMDDPAPTVTAQGRGNTGTASTSKHHR